MKDHVGRRIGNAPGEHRTRRGHVDQEGAGWRAPHARPREIALLTSSEILMVMDQSSAAAAPA